MAQVLDIYDDPAAQVLSNRLGISPNQFPEKLASMELLRPEELSSLPDRLFALVATDRGEPLRKYAMHDESHLATSIAYFMECGGVLPGAAQAKVAENLVNACAWYDTTPPEALVKVALGIGTALNVGLTATAVPGVLRTGKAKGQLAMNALKNEQAQTKMASAGRERQLTSAEEKELASADHDTGSGFLDKYLDEALGSSDDFQGALDEYEGTGSDNAFNAKSKRANLTGTTAGVVGGLSQSPLGKTPEQRFAGTTKAASWDGDITGYDAPRLVPKVASHFALPEISKYPIDDAKQLKIAVAYFDEHRFEMEPEQRRTFAHNVELRAADLGVKVAGHIEGYFGSDYGPHIQAELAARCSAFEGTTKVAAYELLRERQAEIPAPVMVDMLKRADAETRLVDHYGDLATGFRDPYAAVYGKTASEMFSWTHGGLYCNAETLELHSKRTPNIDHLMGDGFSMNYAKDPVGIFRSLPDPQKMVLCRLANATQDE